MLMQTSSSSSLHSSTEQNMCQTKKNTKTIRESDRRERGRNEDRRDGRGTLFIFACAIFANTEMSLFLEMFQWPLAEIEDKKKTKRERGLERHMMNTVPSENSFSPQQVCVMVMCVKYSSHVSLTRGSMFDHIMSKMAKLQDDIIKISSSSKIMSRIESNFSDFLKSSNVRLLTGQSSADIHLSP